MALVVFYGLVMDTEEDGIFLDGPFLGGIVQNTEAADKLAISITNDRALPGTAIIKVFDYGTAYKTFGQVISAAQKHFNQQARDMYDMDDQLANKKRK